MGRTGDGSGPPESGPPESGSKRAIGVIGQYRSHPVRKGRKVDSRWSYRSRPTTGRIAVHCVGCGNWRMRVGRVRWWGGTRGGDVTVDRVVTVVMPVVVVWVATSRQNNKPQGWQMWGDAEVRGPDFDASDGGVRRR
jgi:hypothetical protein